MVRLILGSTVLFWFGVLVLVALLLFGCVNLKLVQVLGPSNDQFQTDEGGGATVTSSTGIGLDLGMLP